MHRFQRPFVVTIGAALLVVVRAGEVAVAASTSPSPSVTESSSGGWFWIVVFAGVILVLGIVNRVRNGGTPAKRARHWSGQSTHYVPFGYTDYGASHPHHDYSGGSSAGGDGCSVSSGWDGGSGGYSSDCGGGGSSD